METVRLGKGKENRVTSNPLQFSHTTETQTCGAWRFYPEFTKCKGCLAQSNPNGLWLVFVNKWYRESYVTRRLAEFAYEYGHPTSYSGLVA